MGQRVSVNAPNEVGAPAVPAEEAADAAAPARVAEGGSRKRRHSDIDDPEDIRTNLDTPTKKRVLSTSRYIYNTLFLNGTGSDVTVVALGTEWNLHRVYLCQAEYFASMFSGSWKESSSNRVEIAIVDENITAEALATVFGTLYSDVLKLAPTKVLGVLAGASMFRLEGVVQEVAEFMLETISNETACTYFIAADMYGLVDVAERLEDWLLLHLLQAFSVGFLQDMSIDLLKRLLSNPNLFVLQVEMDIYTVLKQWLFIQLNMDYDGDYGKVLKLSETYFRQLCEEDPDNRPFLDTEDGKPFVELFQCLRLHHICGDLYSCQMLEHDRIIPASGLLKIYRRQWLLALHSEQTTETGLSGVTDAWFHENSMRYGRLLSSRNTEFCWRWVGYTFGIDMVASFKMGRVCIRRNTTKFPCMRSVHLHPEHRALIIRARAMWEGKDSAGQYRVHCEDTGRLNFFLRPDEEVGVLSVPLSEVSFPIYLSFSVAYWGKMPNPANAANAQRLD